MYKQDIVIDINDWNRAEKEAAEKLERHELDEAMRQFIEDTKEFYEETKDHELSEYNKKTIC